MGTICLTPNYSGSVASSAAKGTGVAIAAGSTTPSCFTKVVMLQAAQLWLQYTSLLAGINIPAPAALHWVFSVANFAFASVTSGALSTDCLLSGTHSAALQRILVHLAVPVLVLLVMVLIQSFWYVLLSVCNIIGS